MRIQVIKILSEISFFEYEEMSDGLLLEEDLGMNSVMLVELVALLEIRSGIVVQDNMAELAECRSVGDILKFVEGVVQVQ